MKSKVFVSKDAEGKDVELKFVWPNRKVRTEADFIWKKAYSHALRAGFLTEAEALRILKEKGIWSEKDDEREQEARSNIAKLELELEQCEDKEKGEQICNDIRELRAELNRLRNIITSATNNTAEIFATENKYEFLASTCVVYNNDKRAFKNIDEFREKLDVEPYAIECYNQAMVYTYENALKIDLDALMNETLPEDKWVSKLEEEELEKTKPVKKKARRSRRKKEEVSK